ncbi:MAG: alpha/beta hydrolase [Pseudomonadota bacterium]|nr:alpha/beta hydrolase [Pseudomonadota bacterium]
MSIYQRGLTSIHYEVLGELGPWVVLTPGGRQGLEAVRGLGERIRDAGYRVLLHDRRNCGASDVSIEDDTQSEQEIWVDDVYALLLQLDALPVIAGGGSAGCRLSLLLSLRHPSSVQGLLLWYVTGGQVAATQLGQAYYGQFIEMAESGGMSAVIESDFFAERIRSNPTNAQRLLTYPVADFVRVMSAWQLFFTSGADLPVIGATREELSSIDVPACIIPGADPVHPRKVAMGLHDILSDSEFHHPFSLEERESLKALPLEEIGRRFDESKNAIFVDFLNRRFPVGT